MSVIFPTRTDGLQAYSMTVQLEGVSFRFDFSWNARGSYWRFNLFDSAGDMLLGRVVRVRFPMLARFRDERLPPGELIAVDTSNQDLDPGLTDLGARVQLTYFTAAEMAAGLAAAGP